MRLTAVTSLEALNFTGIMNMKNSANFRIDSNDFLEKQNKKNNSNKKQQYKISAEALVLLLQDPLLFSQVSLTIKYSLVAPNLNASGLNCFPNYQYICMVALLHLLIYAYAL